MSALSVHDLWHDYDGAPVLERINLDVDEGTFCTIVGASGCGKSTFLRLLLSQERPRRGEIRVDARPLPAEPGSDRGVVFQRYSVFPHLTVLQNLLLPTELITSRWLGRRFGRERRRAMAEAEELLAAIGLDAARDRYPKSLSGGMQQRLAIAQALVLRPRILLLDEPFGALDPGTRRTMHGLLDDVWRRYGMTVFMVTHDLEEGFRLGTRLLVFDKVRHDPQAPEAYGATIIYDLPIHRDAATTAAGAGSGGQQGG